MSRYGYVDKNDLFANYLAEIGRYKLLTREEEIELGTAVQEMMRHVKVCEALNIDLTEYARVSRIPISELKEIYRKGEEAKDKMIKANLRLVVAVAKRYSSINLQIYDMVQEGNIGLIKGVEKYNPVRYDVKLSTYITYWIKESITKGINTTGRTIRLPVHVTDKIRMVRRIRKEFVLEHGRGPTRQELVELTNLPDEMIRKLLSYLKKPASLNTMIDGGDGSGVAFVEHLPDPKTVDNSPLQDNSVIETLKSLLDCLDERERFILLHLRGLFGTPAIRKEEIAEELGISGTRVKQIERAAIRKLREEFSAVPCVYEKLVSCLR